jgi:phytoene dehydrogenase-like protein
VGVLPYERVARWAGTPWHKRGADYDAFKQRLADRLTEVLVRRVPSVAKAIDHAELSTPLTTTHFAGHPQGEIYGLAHNPARFENTQVRVHTPVPGLYLTGADVCTAGVAGALLGGVLTATTVGRNNMLGYILKA